MDIIKWDGRKITRPGIYSGVSMDAYHGDLCDGPSISSSGLRKIEADSLAHYYEDSYLNPDREPETDPQHFSLGKAAHHLVAGQGAFTAEFAIRPDKWDSWRTKDAKAWRADQWLEGKTVLAPDDVQMVRRFANSLGAHPTIRAGILSGLVEHSIFWRDPPTGVWIKARPDFIPLDSNMVVDLKTCASADPHSCRQSITEFGYHQQMGLIHDGLLVTTGRTMEDHVLVFIEKRKPHCINIKPLLPSAIHAGRLLNRRAINKFAVALKTGEWRGYEDDEVPCDILEYARKRLDFEAENGLLPGLNDAPPELSDEAI